MSCPFGDDARNDVEKSVDCRKNVEDTSLRDGFILEMEKACTPGRWIPSNVMGSVDKQKHPTIQTRTTICRQEHAPPPPLQESDLIHKSLLLLISRDG
jgi:hypothetical protein